MTRPPWIVTLNGRRVELGRAEYLSECGRLAGEYVAARTERARNAILARLYAVNLPLFRQIEIFDPMCTEEDARQEGYFILVNALRTFKPGRGAFAAWLKIWCRKYVWDLSERHAAKKRQRTAPPETICEEGRSIFADCAEVLTPDDLAFIRAHFESPQPKGRRPAAYDARLRMLLAHLQGSLGG